MPLVAIKIAISNLMVGDFIFMALDVQASVFQIVQEPLRLLGWEHAVAVVVLGVAQLYWV